MSESERVKSALAALAAGETAHETASETTNDTASYRTVIERATEATADIEAAADFVESVGIDRLEAAIETADHEVSGLASEGRKALAAFEQFHSAAHCDRPDRCRAGAASPDHFHRARDTSLGAAGIRPDR